MLDIMTFSNKSLLKIKNVMTSIIKNMLYRISFLTEMLVDADNLFEAERIAYNNLTEEVKKSVSEIQEICLLNSIEQLNENEQEILPWKSHSDQEDSAKLTAREILLASSNNKKKKRKQQK